MNSNALTNMVDNIGTHNVRRTRACVCVCVCVCADTKNVCACGFAEVCTYVSVCVYMYECVSLVPRLSARKIVKQRRTWYLFSHDSFHVMRRRGPLKRRLRSSTCCQQHYSSTQSVAPTGPKDQLQEVLIHCLSSVPENCDWARLRTIKSSTFDVIDVRKDPRRSAVLGRAWGQS